MTIKEITAAIMNEIDAATQYTDEDTLIKVFATIHGANRIFFHANGRSMLTIKYFAQRLMHQGYRVFIVGDVATLSSSTCRCPFPGRRRITPCRPSARSLNSLCSILWMWA